MKSMKVNCNLKSILNKEFKHDVEHDRCDPRVLKRMAAGLGDARCRSQRPKETNEGTMMWRPEPKSNVMAVADPATTKEPSDIATNCRSRFEIAQKI
jgi:hypothetical protein